ncbi:hypothetical protein JW877_03970 [bacterium]|nr:hypothetical protein [bacterium]
MRTRILLIFGMIILLMMVSDVFSQGTSHIVYGTVVREEGYVTPEACLYLNAYIAARPTIIIDQDSPYFVYNEATGSWYLNLAEILWAPGEVLYVEFTDSCWMEHGIVAGALSNTPEDEFGLLYMSPIEGLRPVLTDPDIDPDEGTVITEFEFTVTYTSTPWNRGPATIEVQIDGIPYGMGALDPFDADFTDGAYYSVIVDAADFGKGTYNYFFHALDTDGLPAFTDEFEFTILNTPPTAPVVDINPALPFVDEDLDCIILTDGTDIDAADAVTYQYQWYLDGELQVGMTTQMVPSGFTAVGELWMVIVTSFDGEDTGGADTAWVTIIAPLLTDGMVDPERGDLTTNFTYSVTYSNPRGIAPGTILVQNNYGWFEMGPEDSLDTDYEGGVLYTFSTTLPDFGYYFYRFYGEDADGHTAFGDTGIHAGPSVENDLPVITLLDVNPDFGYENTVFEITVVATDPNSDPVTFFYQWYNQDGIISGATGPDLNGDRFDKGDTLYCIVSPFDGYEYGVAQQTELVPVLNSPPIMTSVDLIVTPEGDVTELSTLTAYGYGAMDIDGDSVWYVYQWYDQTGIIVPWNSIQAITGEYFDKFDTIYCHVRPYDGDDYGDPIATGWVVIVNTPPVISSAYLQVNPDDEAYETSTITAIIREVEDPDGDVYIFHYNWLVNGVELGLDPSTNSIDGDNFDKHDWVSCWITPYDYEDYGVPFPTDTVYIMNSIPYFTSLDIFPGRPHTNDDLECFAGFDDDDPGDALTVSYSWYQDGRLVDALTGNIVTSDYTASWEIWTCVVEINDGEAWIYDTVEVMILNTPPVIGPIDDTVAVAETPYTFQVEVNDPDFDRLWFELLAAPEGMLIDHETGRIFWGDPAGVEAMYWVVLAVFDGYAADTIAYPLWLIQWDDMLLAPFGLNAHSGFLAVIPLDWQQPDIFDMITGAVFLNFEYYEIYRSADLETYDLLATTYLPNYTDVDVVPGVIYFYKVRTVYSTGVSPFCEMDYASAADEGAAMWSPYTDDPVPFIDGFLDPAEWADANVMPFMVEDTPNAYMFIKHTDDDLFIGIVNYNDTYMDIGDQLLVSMDDNFNESWPLGAPSGEGEYLLRLADFGPISTFQGIWGSYPYDIVRDLRHPSPAVFGEIGMYEDRFVSYEMRISLTDIEGYNEALFAQPGDYVGFRFALYDAGLNSWNLIWPDGSDAENPVSFGDLLLQEKIATPTIVVNPRAFDVYLPMGETSSRIMEIENVGEGALVFDITENYTPFGGVIMSDMSPDVIILRNAASLTPIAMAYLGYAYSDYTDYSIFISALESADWDLAIVDIRNADYPELWNALQRFVSGGGHLIIASPDLDMAAGHPLWSDLGMAINEDLGDRPSAISWEIAGHPIFNMPETIFPITHIAGDYDDYGDNIDITSASALATFNRFPYLGNAAIAINETENVIVNSFIFAPEINMDRDGMADCVELLINEIIFLSRATDIPWLSVFPTFGGLPSISSTHIEVNFDATELGIGDYFGYLLVKSNDPGNRVVVVPCHMEIGPVEYDTLRLWFPEEVIRVKQGDIFEVPLFVSDCFELGITEFTLTVQCNDRILSPTDVRSDMADLEILGATTYSVDFRISRDFPFGEGGLLAWVEFTVDPTAFIGSYSNIWVAALELNDEAEVDEIELYNGQVAIISRETDWGLTLWISVGEDDKDTVWIGINPAATNMFDPLFDVLSDDLSYDAYSDISLWDTLFPNLDVDIRPSGDGLVTWYINTGMEEGKVQWAFREEDTLSEMGTLFLNGSIDMKGISVYDFTAGEVLEIGYQTSAMVPFVYHFDPGYNMVSLPIYMPSQNIAEIFPDYIEAWWFDPDENSWVTVTSMEYGFGYLILFFEEHDYVYWSYPLTEYSVALAEGWNLIGSIYETIDFSNPDDTPDGSILPGTYYYSALERRYVASDVLKPGYGYFIAARVNCLLHAQYDDGMGMPRIKPSDASIPLWELKLNTLIAKKNNCLTIGVGPETLRELLPPSLPDCEHLSYLQDGQWHTTKHILQEAEVNSWNLVLHSETKLSWDPTCIPANLKLVIQGTGKELDLAKSSSIDLPAGNYKLTASMQNLPTAFRITQNYPNPFNAVTAIDYDIPCDTQVRIDVYNLIGEKVNTLIDENQKAGYKHIMWEGTDQNGDMVPSGVYFYRIEAGSFKQINRMVLMK